MFCCAPAQRARAFRFDSTGACLASRKAYAPLDTGADQQAKQATALGFALQLCACPRAQSRFGTTRTRKPYAALCASSRFGASRVAHREKFNLKNAQR